ncbi:MAG: hypothetical protein HUU55_06895 [Myxococcales bacterium]|nr:hypothetical protein [Myxococcales bacterium]
MKFLSWQYFAASPAKIPAAYSRSSSGFFRTIRRKSGWPKIPLENTCHLVLALTIFSCSDDNDSVGNSTNSGDIIASDVQQELNDVEQSVAKFAASIQLPNSAPHGFVANLGVKCSFQKLDQLLITATGASESASESIVIRIGVSKVTSIAPGGSEFPFQLVGVGKDVDPGTASWSYETDGAVLLSAGLVDASSKVTLTSLSPCEGTFDLSWTDVEGQTISIDGGSFQISLTESL